MINIEEQIFEVNDANLISELFGSYDENMKIIEDTFSVQVISRDQNIKIAGERSQVQNAKDAISALLKIASEGKEISPQSVRYVVSLVNETSQVGKDDFVDNILTTAKGRQIKTKTHGQKNYLEAIRNNSLTFVIGPAGTGKTYIAVAMAVLALKNKEIDRIVLTRPAVEAGEKLGFLPGDLQEKIDPYLRPLYDALYDFIGPENCQKYISRGIIEVAPLAYMRGRTLDNSFIILDEAQNTTSEQMKMFLTRLGIGSKAVVTGDVTQIDLPRDKVSGIVEVQKILKDIKGIEFIRLNHRDVVRHELVQKIIKAYNIYEDRAKNSPEC